VGEETVATCPSYIAEGGLAAGGRGAAERWNFMRSRV
jgi:hypothetical protein